MRIQLLSFKIRCLCTTIFHWVNAHALISAPPPFGQNQLSARQKQLVSDETFAISKHFSVYLIIILSSTYITARYFYVILQKIILSLYLPKSRVHFSPISPTVLHFDSRGGFGYVWRHLAQLPVLSNFQIYIIFSINKCQYIFLNNTGNIYPRKRLKKKKSWSKVHSGDVIKICVDKPFLRKMKY